MSSFGIRVDLSAFERTMDADAKACEDAARPAAQAGADVLYQAVKANVARIRRKTGNLAASIYQAYSQDHSAPGKATYHVSWNARKAPHGHLVEWGHLQRYLVTRDARGRFVTHKDKPLAAPIQIPARPFVRPAMAQMPAAEDAMRERFLAELQQRGVIR